MGLKKGYREQIPEGIMKEVEKVWQSGNNLNCKINREERGLVSFDDISQQAQEGWEQEVLSRVAANEVVNALLDGLSPKQALVIKQRFLFEEGEKTLQEVADSLGVSAVRVREIQQKALSKMLIRARSKGINDILK